MPTSFRPRLNFEATRLRGGSVPSKDDGITVKRCDVRNGTIVDAIDPPADPTLDDLAH
jgi:hypothetical protein